MTGKIWDLPKHKAKCYACYRNPEREHLRSEQVAWAFYEYAVEACEALEVFTIAEVARYLGGHGMPGYRAANLAVWDLYLHGLARCIKRKKAFATDGPCAKWQLIETGA